MEISSGLLSLVPISDALAVKENLTMESVVLTLRSLDGRDKATKMLQYVARFLYWWYSTSDPAVSRRAFNLYRTTQRSRKAFRLLKVLDEVIKLRQILRDAGGKGRGFLDYMEALSAARCLAMGCFWTYDNLDYLITTQTINFGVDWALKGFSRSYSVSSALYILLGVESLRTTNNKRRQVAAQYADAIGRRTVTAESGLAEGLVEQYAGSRQGNREEIRLREALKDANAEHFKSWLILVKGLVDLTCASNMAGMDIPMRLLGRKLNDGVISVAGFISALCVLYNTWPSRQRKSPGEQSSDGMTPARSQNGQGPSALTQENPQQHAESRHTHGST